MNAVIAAVMAFATFVLYLNWRWGSVEWWWVALGAATTVGYALAVRARPPPPIAPRSLREC